MKWRNIQIGEFEYDSKHIITFPEGLLGFEDLHKFILINDEQSEPFLWLVSLEDEAISFPVLEPHTVFPSYTTGVFEDKESTILVLVSLKPSLEESTVNLRSPIIISNETQEGRQVVLENEEYQFQHPLFPLSVEPVKG